MVGATVPTTTVETAGTTTETTAETTAETTGPGGGNSTGGSGGADLGGGDVSCPTKPPFDETDAALVEKCTRPVVVGVGNGLRRVASENGQTWDVDEWFPDGMPDQNENSHRDVLVANGIVVIAGDGGLLVSLDGGQTYSTQSSERLHDAGVGFFQGAFWVVSSGGTFSSSDGTNWTTWPGDTPLPGDLPGKFSADSIATTSSKLVAMSGRDNKYRIFDGATWTEYDFGPELGSLARISFGADRFAIVSWACCDESMFAGLRANSSDGVSWNVVTNASPGAPDYRFGDLIWDGQQFFATASQYDNRGYTSTDGLDWVPRTMTVSLGTITVLDGVYIGSNGATLYRSTDGTTWTMTHTAVGDDNWGFTRLASGRVLQ